MSLRLLKEWRRRFAHSGGSSLRRRCHRWPWQNRGAFRSFRGILRRARHRFGRRRSLRLLRHGWWLRRALADSSPVMKLWTRHAGRL